MPEVMPPCQYACPVRTDTGGYARLIAEGRDEEAYKVVCRTNPFPSVCAHICQRHCEKKCRRAEIDAAVALRALKHFVVEHVPRTVGAEPLASETGASRRVAVVGAGPSGLTAAYDLRRRGHRVSVFERLARPGGMLNVIPRYRLPPAALDADIEAILASGIELTCECEVGRDQSATELLDKGFDAVIVGTGLSRSRGIAVPGFGAQRFMAAVPWMTDVWLGNKVDVGRRVVVVGGGNVAVDVARTARRLGAEHVTMVCLESWEEMPAEPEEVTLAQEEGIRILPRQALKRVLNRDGQIAAIELMAVRSVFDEEGRFRPSYDPMRVRTLSVEMVILSIGQAPDRSWARGTSVSTDGRGRIVADRDTHVTSIPRVFLAGESLRGPGSAIEAVADGHRVAGVVAHFLASGHVVAPEAEQDRPLGPYPSDVLTELRQIQSTAREAEPFAAAEPSLSESDARSEADRCLGCTLGAEIDETQCASCLTCFRVCPLDAIEIAETLVANPERCQACGLCAAICPASAIGVAYWQLGDRESLSPRAVDGEEPTIALVCRHGAERPTAATRIADVPCLARLRPADLLSLFRLGYRAVSLYPCSEEECKYGSVWRNTQSVVDQVRGILNVACPGAQVELRSADDRAATSAEVERGE